MPFESRERTTPTQIAPGYAISIERRPRLNQHGTEQYNERLSKEIARFQSRTGAPARLHIEYTMTLEKNGSYYLPTYDERYVLSARKEGDKLIVEKFMGSSGITLNLSAFEGYRMESSGKSAGDYAREVLAEQYLRYAFAKSNLTSLGFRNAKLMENSLTPQFQDPRREVLAIQRQSAAFSPKFG